MISLAGSGQVAPNQWLNFDNGVNYDVGVQTPQYRIQSLDDLKKTPISSGSQRTASTTQAGTVTDMTTYGAPGETQLLQNLATFKRTSSVSIVNHYNVQPVYDVYANTDRRDLGGVAGDVEKIVAEFQTKTSARLVLRSSRPGSDHGVVIREAWSRPSFCHPSGLLADGR